MDIKKEAMSGSLQSNDCIVRIYPSDGYFISIESILINECRDEIEKAVEDTLKSLGINKIRLELNDNGALDSTISYRIKKAVERSI